MNLNFATLSSNSNNDEGEKSPNPATSTSTATATVPFEFSAKDADGFATPGAPSSRASRGLRRSRRLTQFAQLLDPIPHQHHLTFERGSTSEKRRAARRRRTGTPARDWRTELLAGIPDDATSPVHQELRHGYWISKYGIEAIKSRSNVFFLK